VLKALFSSKTRIKILEFFFLHPDDEYFIRELTRILDEQINSVRRELESLQKIGMFSSRVKDGKKYFHLDKTFFLYAELLRIFQKMNSPAMEIAKKLKKMGKVDVLIVSGVFVGSEDSPVDLLIVGSVDRDNLNSYISQELKSQNEIRFALLTKSDFLYRLKCRDKIILKLLSESKNIVPINKMSNVFDPS
jgi:hypothetical protein